MTKNWKYTKRNYKCLLKRERHTLKWGLMLLLSICIIGGYGQSRSNHEALFASTTGGEIAAGDNGGADVGDDVRLNQQGDLPAEAIAVEETPSQVQEVVPPHSASIARVTAYSCGGLTTHADIVLNCPSLLSGGPRTASGTTPIPYYTVACDKANMGREFEVEKVGRVKCEDSGGAVRGAGRFDLYLATVQEARAWGVRYLEYKLVE